MLARIIPDEEQAISSAAGIKLLTDLLHDSKSDFILALTADCIARLAHTRAGTLEAFGQRFIKCTTVFQNNWHILTLGSVLQV